MPVLPRHICFRYDTELCGDLYLRAALRSTIPAHEPDAGMEPVRHNAVQHRLSGDTRRRFRPIAFWERWATASTMSCSIPPEVSPGPLDIDTNPRNGKPEFNISLFAPKTSGQLGNAARRFFYGPGIDNFDMQISKTVRLAESKSLEIRVEAFQYI
jgi:hypothetical protein